MTPISSLKQNITKFWAGSCYENLFHGPLSAIGYQIKSGEKAGFDIGLKENVMTYCIFRKREKHSGNQ